MGALQRCGKVLSRYDQDLRWSLLAVYGVMALNLGVVITAVIQRNWMLTLAAGIWVINNRVWLSLVRNQQHTRDFTRIHTAGLMAALERKVNED